MWICIAPRREHTSKVLRYGTRSQGISQFYLHTRLVNRYPDIRISIYTIDIRM